MILERNKNNPIIKRDDVKDNFLDITSVFNPGAIKVDDDYYLILRVQDRSRQTMFLKAKSKNGIDFTIQDTPIHLMGIETVNKTIYHCYDPRITSIGDRFYMMFSMDMEDGCYLGLAETVDFEQFYFRGIVSEDENRNGVLFPELVNGKYLRCDRPNTQRIDGRVVSGNSICLSSSDDMQTWEVVDTIASGNPHYWDELIGAGPPPVKTKQGWLLVYHGIARHYQPIYQAGVMLLDLEQPSQIIARGKLNILEPRELYEMIGQVPNVVFPTGIIVENYDKDSYAENSSKVLLYYGAADTSVCLAESTVEKLIYACYQ